MIGMKTADVDTLKQVVEALDGKGTIDVDLRAIMNGPSP
jgi:hypothetical protein